MSSGTEKCTYAIILFNNINAYSAYTAIIKKEVFILGLFKRTKQKTKKSKNVRS